MRCRKGRLCNNFILSTSVTVVGTSLVVNIPTLPCTCGCIAISQAIPAAATVNMPVFITVGTDATQYPLVDNCGVQISAGRLDIRNRYPFKFITANTTSIFKVCGSRCPYNIIPGLTPTVTG